MKLEIELVPRPLWWTNPRKVLGTYNWGKIRRPIYEKQDYKCAICNNPGRLECHETWSYDDEKRIQKLVGLIALCPLCHQVKHIGRTSILATEGIVNLEEVTNHFLKINNCTKEDMQKHMREVQRMWIERSKYEDWEIDWNFLEKEIEKVKEKGGKLYNVGQGTQKERGKQ